jgi:hypothetical protein
MEALISRDEKLLTQARAYALTPGGANTKTEEAKVVTGTLLLFGSHACALFNSATYVKMCSINTELLWQKIYVETPIGNTIMCKHVVEGCPIVIEGRTLSVNLVVFKMLGFDVILGWVGYRNTMRTLIVKERW